MNRLIEIITSDDDQVRDQSLESVCRDAVSYTHLTLPTIYSV